MPATYSEYVGTYGDDYIELWCAWMVPCPECGGDGGRETMPTGPHETAQWIECAHCSGTGTGGAAPAGIELTDD